MPTDVLNPELLSDTDIDDTVLIADQLAHHYLGSPEEDMLLELHDVRARVASELAEQVGADIAATIAAAFVATVVRRRREIECYRW